MLKRLAPLEETLGRYTQALQKGDIPFSLQRKWPGQERLSAIYMHLAQTSPDCFSRDNLPGHITGSALILNPQRTALLLTHHVKMDRWLQLGGHCEPGETLPAQTALREALEESGLATVYPLSLHLEEVPLAEATPVDLDIHLIPDSPKLPSHRHFDIRFLFQATTDLVSLNAEESHDLKWIPFDEVTLYTKEESMLRQFDVVKALMQRSLGAERSVVSRPKENHFLG